MAVSLISQETKSCRWWNYILKTNSWAMGEVDFKENMGENYRKAALLLHLKQIWSWQYF